MDDLAMLDQAETQLYQAKEVQHFLRHEAVRKAFAATEDRIARQWKSAATLDAREALWHKLQAFRELQTELRASSERKTE